MYGLLVFTQYMQMAQHLGVSQSYKQDGVSQVQQRGVSMIMSSDSSGVPYSHVVPQLATLQIGSSVNISYIVFKYWFIKKILFSFCLQYISPPYPYYPQTIIPAMQMADSEQASTAASPDEAYNQYSHPVGPK